MHYRFVFSRCVRIFASLCLFGLLALTGSSGQPAPPLLRIGLQTKQAETRLQGSVPLQVWQNETVALEYPAGQPLVFRAREGTIAVFDAANTLLLTATAALRVTVVPLPHPDGPDAPPPATPLISLLGPSRHYDGRPDRPYRGSMLLLPQQNTLTVVNLVDLESYLWGVVSSEMGVGYPTEALKAQAVAARTYALKNIGRLAAEGYDLDDTARCQVYGGYFSEDPRTTAAVDATTGQVLTCRGTLIDAVYSSTCGGFTESAETAWGYPVPYLSGVSDEPEAGPPAALPHSEEDWAAFFKSAPALNCLQPKYARPEAYRWVKIATRKELEAGLPESCRVGTLLKIVPLKRGTSGRILSLQLEGTERTAVINDEGRIRAALGRLRSSAFTVDSYPDDAGKPVVFAFWGGGWGHGIGMCQVGAVGLALQGWSFDRILARYYRGAVLAKRQE